MSNTIQPNDFAKAINELLDEYGDEVGDALQEVVKSTAKDASDKLKHQGEFNDITGDYRKSWRFDVKVTPLNVVGTVYAKEPHYRLTHLLEFGHAKQSGGRTRAFPHISIVNDWVGEEVVDRLERKLK